MHFIHKDLMWYVILRECSHNHIMVTMLVLGKKDKDHQYLDKDGVPYSKNLKTCFSTSKWLARMKYTTI